MYQPFLQGTWLPLSRKWYLEAKIRLLSVLIAMRLSPALGSLCGWNYGICVYIYMYAHTHTHLYLHFYI